MWPKMLFELLPHFARLMPMADKYFSTRSASEKAQEAALAALALEIRAELGRGTEAQAGLAQQVQEQSVQIGDLALDVAHTRISVDGVESKLDKMEQTMDARIAKLERTARVAVRLSLVLMAMLAAALGLLVIVLASLFRR